MFTEEMINRVWQDATPVQGYDPDLFRKDCCGAWIVRNAYGNIDSIYGWEIDHVYPQSLGGGDDLDNLRAMQWENNRSKGNDYPYYTAVVLSEGNKNIHESKSLMVNNNLQDRLSTLYNIN
jgi:hypothetical protein